MFVLAGRSALSPFRLERLNREVQAVAPGVAIAAAWWVYVVDATGAAEPDRARLATILQADGAPAHAATIFTLPRLGTISPWSSKATEILAGCGLPIARVERGMALAVSGLEALAEPARRAALGRLHDPMTQSVVARIEDAAGLFRAGAPAPLERIALGADPRASLAAANAGLGLALSADEVDYLARRYGELGRDPSDAELMMFAQANSEHCRHKVFNAAWRIDGADQPASLFAMIKNTHRASPAHTLSAYHDNAAVIEGAQASRFFPSGDAHAFAAVTEQVDFAIKVETHNHPTAIAPYPGASTGSGGEIRDEGATGRGGKPKAGLTGFSVSHLRIPGLPRAWEGARALPPRMASAFEIMRDGPIGAAAFNNEFGRPALLGYFRSFELPESAGLVRGYDKPIMLAGGLANIRRDHVDKRTLSPGDAIVVLGGPAMLIGLGGGAASSVAGGESSAELDFASVQRDNPEMQRRCQEVIDRCWQLGADNPIVSVHDVGAGGLSNAIPELLNDSKVGGLIDLRAIPSADPTLSPMQVWCNESQERYVLGVAPASLTLFEALCARERCPYAVVGHATAERHLTVADPVLGAPPVDLPLDLLFGSAPKMLRDVARPAARARPPAPAAPAKPNVDAALRAVLSHPTVASKSYLVTIGDRTVGGLCARDQMVGPWQVPVADCALTLNDFDGYAGEAMAIGERTPIALLDAAASARMAVGEAVTNLLGAPIEALGAVRLSANWMAAVSHPGEDVALFDAVRAVGMELCPALGISIPVGKDSLSMQAVWRGAQDLERVVAPVSLIVSAFVRVADVRRALTPQLVLDAGATELLLVDLGNARNRLGGSILAQIEGAIGTVPPDLDDAAQLQALFDATQALAAAGVVLALHDRSDGGLAATLAEMAFAGHCGLEIELPAALGDVLPALFAEELGVVLQVRDADVPRARAVFAEHGLGPNVHALGRAVDAETITIKRGAELVGQWRRAELFAAWHETSHAMQRLRDNPESADAERDLVQSADDPGIAPTLTFDAADDVAAPFVARGARPRLAVLREQGVNGQVEMAAAFTRAGFDAFDVHMTDLIEGRVKLDDFAGFAACGGFSYGDVLGAGRGWATSIAQRAALAAQFERFLADRSRFALGVCNGCQMLAALKPLIPGAAHWPSLERNRSEQYEARLATIEILDSPSILFSGMAGSRIPVAVAHGEGFARFAEDADPASAGICARFVDNRGAPTEAYPLNPNGSPGGATGFTAADGRVTILMPHPERVFRSVQMSWRPREWGEDSPWMRMFRNARAWLG